MVFNIPKQTYNRATISAKDNTVILEGDIDQNQPEDFLKPFFNQISSREYESLTIDISNLEFLNSAGIKCLLDFLSSRIPQSKVTIKTDQKKTWQRNSMTVIQSIDEKNISLIDKTK